MFGIVLEEKKNNFITELHKTDLYIWGNFGMIYSHPITEEIFLGYLIT